MIWRAIGQSVIGTSHVQTGKDCEDAIDYKTLQKAQGDVLICCVSDGAGSARYAREASRFITSRAVAIMAGWAAARHPVTESEILQMAEDIYDHLFGMAQAAQAELNEYSATFLGCYLGQSLSVFYQIGDGAIVRSAENGDFTTVWWPHNGEYSNTTSFLIDDPSFSNLKMMILQETVQEVALFTDGLQHLVLNTETSSVHQPFFEDLFKWLRRTETEAQIGTLNGKLAEYLGSQAINSRTDDDKTLFLATRTAQ